MKRVFIKQDGTKFVIDNGDCEVRLLGGRIVINGEIVAEYLSEDDASEAMDILLEDYNAGFEVISLPVKHFGAEPFAEYAWYQKEIAAFLEVTAKLPSSFLDEFCRIYKEKGFDKAHKAAKYVADFVRFYDEELTLQVNGRQES